MKFRNLVTQADVAAIRKMVVEAGVFSEEEIDVAEELAQDAATHGPKSHYCFILADLPSSSLPFPRKRESSFSSNAEFGDRLDSRFLGNDNKENSLAGYTCFGRIPLTDERYDLYWIVTDANRQRKGIASELMQRTEKAVRALGGKAIYAETSSRTIYKPAQRFYIKQGFTLAAEVKDFYRKGDDKLLYCRAL